MYLTMRIGKKHNAQNGSVLRVVCVCRPGCMQRRKRGRKTEKAGKIRQAACAAPTEKTIH